jgi:hypothetical protein
MSRAHLVHQDLYRIIERALLGVPKTASAEEVNLRLRVQVDWRALPCSYSYWRACVRAIQAERAQWCIWEGKDPAGVRPRRRTRVRGVTV